MARNGNDWVTFMRSRPARIALNGMGAVLCATNVIDAAAALLGGNPPAALVGSIGLPGYYVLTVARLGICLAATCFFSRDAYRAYASTDDDEGA